MSTHADDLGDWVNELTGEARAYAERTREQVLLEVSKRTAVALAGVVMWIVRLVVALLTFSLLLVAGGLWLGELIGDRALGFVAMAGVCMLVGLVFALYWRSGGRERFMLGIINAIVHGQ
jgi:uncharacterized membrane protein YecN with MAPEG domain